jgi:hypothetical protein
MLTSTSILLTLESATHGATGFLGPRAASILELVAAFPEPKRAELKDAPAALAAASMPIVAGMLPGEGFLRFWELDGLQAEARHRCEQQRENFVQWFEDRAAQFKLQPSDPIILPNGPSRLTLPWSEVRDWVSAVTMFTVGSTLVWNEGAVFLALIATDGTMNFVRGPDYDGCSHDH